jgi:hypothetical protein
MSALNFLALERAHDAFEEALRQYQMALARAAAQNDDESQPLSIAAIRRANTVESSFMGEATEENNSNKYESHPTSIERLCPTNGTPDTIHVMCTWHAQDFIIRGQNHIRGLLVRPLSISHDTCPITITCTHPSVMSNDFTVGPAVVPMNVTLVNQLVSSTVQLDIVMESSTAFDISGPEQYRLTLRGGEHISIPYEAFISNVGVYNLQNVRILILSNDHHSQSVSTPYTFQHQWMVTVNSV